MKCMLFGTCPWFLPHLNSRLLTSECSQEFTPEMTFHVNKLACIFLKYRQNAQTCISVARNQVAEDNLNAKISQAIGELPDGTKWLNSPEAMSCSISHALFSVQPSSQHRIGIPILASHYISSLLFDKVAEENIMKALKMLQMFLCTPMFRTSARKLFKLFGLAALQRQGGKYDITPIHAPNDTNMNLVMVPAGNTSCSILSFEKDSELEALSSLHPGKVILPISSTFPTIDRMLFDLLSCAWLFLLMIAEDHVLQTSGLQCLKKALPDKYQPMKNKKWKIVIIKLRNECFNATPFKGNKKSFWDLYVEQYIRKITKPLRQLYVHLSILLVLIILRQLNFEPHFFF